MEQASKFEPILSDSDTQRPRPPNFLENDRYIGRTCPICKTISEKHPSTDDLCKQNRELVYALIQAQKDISQIPGPPKEKRELIRYIGFVLAGKWHS